MIAFFETYYMINGKFQTYFTVYSVIIKMLIAIEGNFFEHHLWVNGSIVIDMIIATVIS